MRRIRHHDQTNPTQLNTQFLNGLLGPVRGADTAVHDHPKYAEWKAALERLIAAQDRLEASVLEREMAYAERASAIDAYQKVCDDLRLQ